MATGRSFLNGTCGDSMVFIVGCMVICVGADTGGGAGVGLGAALPLPLPTLSMSMRLNSSALSASPPSLEVESHELGNDTLNDDTLGGFKIDRGFGRGY